jgi:mRNA-degrading endonuclease toxin of MazEF toxin-antitoxin module
MVSQYDVYWVDLNPTLGAEMRKIRPCVIVSPKELNDHLDTIIIIPVTSSNAITTTKIRHSYHDVKSLARKGTIYVAI